MWKEILFGNYKRILTAKTKPEDKLSIELTSILVSLTIQDKLDAVWFHVGNEAGRNTKFFTIMQKSKGVVPGVADYIFIGKVNLALELKIGNNKISDKQQAFSEWCKLNGIMYYVARTVPEALAILNSSGLLPQCTYLFSLRLHEQVAAIHYV